MVKILKFYKTQLQRIFSQSSLNPFENLEQTMRKGESFTSKMGRSETIIQEGLDRPVVSVAPPIIIFL